MLFPQRYNFRRMKHALKLIAAGIGLASLSAQALAINMAGVWKGKLQVDISKMSSAIPADQQAGIRKGVEQSKSVLITATLNANGTYTVSYTGLKQKKGNRTETGTWKQVGSSVLMTPAAAQPNGKPRTQTLIVSTDGKTMVLQLPAKMGIVSRMVFHR